MHSKVAILLISLFLLLNWKGLFAQEKVSQAQARLEKIYQEIGKLEDELKNTEQQKQSELSVLKQIERQETLLRQAVRLLDKEIERTNRDISALHSQVETLSSQVSELKQLFEQQLLAYFKFTRSGQLEWLLGAKNFNQLLVRNRYFKMISAGVEHTLARLNDKRTQLESTERKRRDELRRKKELASRKRKEQKALQRKRSQRKSKIDKIIRDSALLRQSLAEKRANYEKLKNMIRQLRTTEAGSRAGAAEFDQALWEQTRGDFSRARKKLNWPAKGKILHRFGKYRNPRLKTTLINNGVDIQAPKGSQVRCVFPGVVSLVVYMGGFGNTVIMDHGAGYYSVYAHLEDVLVQKFQILKAGEVIGTVGDSGSLEGALLHFEIYQNDKPVDPLRWLK